MQQTQSELPALWSRCGKHLRGVSCLLMKGCRFSWTSFLAATLVIALWLAPSHSSQSKERVFTAGEKPIADQLRFIRNLGDDVRVQTTRDLAQKIRKLPVTKNKLYLAMWLAGRSTEGDIGHDTLQEVATTLAEALREQPVPWPEQKSGDSATPAARRPAEEYLELATLVRYEHVNASLDDPQFAAAIA